MLMSAYRGRFAPSPSGDLHLGSASSALCAWLAARSCSGTFVLRIEDIDTPRVVDCATERILEDLKWLGLDWDEGPDLGGPHAPYLQSSRIHLYQHALDRLQSAGLVYPCDCSRAEMARAASAPHPGDDGSIYPGTCRRVMGVERSFRRTPAVRLAVPQDTVVIDDAIQGRHASHVASETGDFVLRRGDGLFAYQLAVVVDDLDMRISEVVRGADLLGSAPRQALLARLLGCPPPTFAHAPLLVSHDGSRLAKRSRATSVRFYREIGLDPREVIASLAHALGLAASHEQRLSPADLIPRFSWAAIRPGPVPVPSLGSAPPPDH